MRRRKRISYKKLILEVILFLGTVLGIILQICNFFKLIPKNYESSLFLSIIAIAILYFGCFGICISGICYLGFEEVRNDMTFFKGK